MNSLIKAIARLLGMAPKSSKIKADLPKQKPFKPLNNAQRRALDPPKPKSPPSVKTAAKVAAPTQRPATRAIRSGWQLCQVAFEYEDSAGNWTDRKVTVHHVDPRCMKGECHAARAERTFRIDRIMSDITDLETGEILDVDDWVRLYR